MNEKYNVYRSVTITGLGINMIMGGESLAMNAV